MMDEKRPDDESLRLEYKIAHEKHDYYGKILWQIGSIFLPACLAGFGFGIQQDLTLEKFIALNSVLSALLLNFLFQARRLRHLAFTYLQRCEDIEKDLKIQAVTLQRISNEKPIEIGGKTVKPQRITGKFLNQVIPIALLCIFWGYVIYIFGLIPYLRSMPTT